MEMMAQQQVDFQNQLLSLQRAAVPPGPPPGLGEALSTAAPEALQAIVATSNAVQTLANAKLEETTKLEIERAKISTEERAITAKTFAKIK